MAPSAAEIHIGHSGQIDYGRGRHIRAHDFLKVEKGLEGEGLEGEGLEGEGTCES